MRPLPKIFLIPIPQFWSRFSAGDENDWALKGKSSWKNFITADLNILSQHARLTTYHKKISQAKINIYQHFLHLSFFKSLNSRPWLKVIIHSFHKFRLTILPIFNSHAVGMAVAQPLDFEIDSARNPISGSATWFFLIILKFIFTVIFEIKNHVKKFFGAKKISFSKTDFYKQTLFPPLLRALTECWLSAELKNFILAFSFSNFQLIDQRKYRPNYKIYF